jgi:stage V sporulation protein K
LLQRMENDRHRLVVIVAGYSERMEEFLRGNPGLRSRFPERIHFADYTAGELVAIFQKMAADNDYELPPRTEKRVREVMETLYANKAENFGNARTVRNIFEDSIAAQASRLAAKEGGIDPKELSRLEPQDIVVEPE